MDERPEWIDWLGYMLATALLTPVGWWLHSLELDNYVRAWLHQFY